METGIHEAPLRRHRSWMATEKAKRAYRRRMALVEPLFAILKNQLGARRFTLRGMDNVKAEWTDGCHGVQSEDTLACVAQPGRPEQGIHLTGCAFSDLSMCMTGPLCQ